MKKTTIIIFAIITALSLFFTACGKEDDNKTDVTTTMPAVTTTLPSTTMRNDTTDSMSGVPESTRLDSAIGNAAEDIVDGAGDVAEDIGDAAERVGDRIGNADERLADDMRNNNNR